MTNTEPFASTGATRSCRIDRTAIERGQKDRATSGRRLILADTICPGLRLVLNAKSGSWTYAYRPRGRTEYGERIDQKTLKLGDLYSVTVSEARRLAEDAKASVREGRDPQLEKQKEAKLAAEQILRRRTLKQLADAYIKSELTSGSAYHKAEALHIRKVLAELQVENAEADSIQARDIQRLVKIHAAKPATARQRLGAIGRFLDTLVGQEIIAVNPVGLLERRNRPKPPPPRDRCYSAAEMQRLWAAAEALPDAKRDFLRLMLLVPLRSGEMSELTFENVDLKDGVLRLDRLQTKNGEPFVIPLPDAALKILTARLNSTKEAGKTGQRVFQLSSKPGEAMTSWSYFTKQINQLARLGDFGFHHFRRTFLTELSEDNQVSETVADSLLNHKMSATRSGVMRHYQHAKLIPQKRAAMQRWGQLVAAVVQTGKWPREGLVD